MKKLIVLLAFVACVSGVNAQRYDKLVEVFVTPVAGQWSASLDETPAFKVSVIESGLPAQGTVDYVIKNDLTDRQLTGTVELVDGAATLAGIAPAEACFEQCSVVYRNAAGKEYKGLGTMAFAPEQVVPVVENPADFDEYWQKAIAQCRKGDLNVELSPLPERSTKKVDAYRMSFSAGPAGKFYGMLAVPKGEGPWPAVVQYPGAGVYAIDPNIALAEKGVITLAFNIHGIAPDLPAEVYNDLAAGALKAYPTINVEDADNYYYRRVVQGAVRAIDAVRSLPECNGRVATYGGSQGGYLSIVTAALVPDVAFVAANYPALSDMAAYTRYQTGGWPHHLKAEANRTPAAMHTLSLYDTVNFARRLAVPGFYSFGLNDLTCAPRTGYGVYNSITAPKQLFVAPLTGHYTTSEQRDATTAALLSALK